jgi:O-antigen/teichoic acid export membrane protein
MLLYAVSQQTAAAVIATGVLVAGLVALVIVAWIFWRAARRDREAERRDG